jgi:hypothetical protein
MNNILFVSIIIILFSIIVYMYIDKNQEIDNLSKKTSKENESQLRQDLQNCNTELANLGASFREFQEEISKNQISGLDNLLNFANSLPTPATNVS